MVAGTLTNPANCGSGYVPMDTLTSTVSQLSKEYGDFGGVAGWEYFNSDPGGTACPLGVGREHVFGHERVTA